MAGLAVSIPGWFGGNPTVQVEAGTTQFFEPMRFDSFGAMQPGGFTFRAGVGLRYGGAAVAYPSPGVAVNVDTMSLGISRSHPASNSSHCIGSPTHDNVPEIEPENVPSSAISRLIAGVILASVMSSPACVMPLAIGSPVQADAFKDSDDFFEEYFTFSCTSDGFAPV